MVIALDVLGFVAGLAVTGFRGSGGGARSGSELSHLDRGNGQYTNVFGRVCVRNQGKEVS